MKKILTILLAAIGLSTACSQNFDNTDVKEFAELISDSSVIILDVRTVDEYAEGHIKGAILIDQNKSDFVEQDYCRLLPQWSSFCKCCKPISQGRLQTCQPKRRYIGMDKGKSTSDKGIT